MYDVSKQRKKKFLIQNNNIYRMTMRIMNIIA